MSEKVIEVKGLSKRYRLGLKEKKAETFAGQLARLAKAPIQNFRQLAQMTRFGEDDESVFWALKDIDFSVTKGQVVGIIGRNGAGKSTLLKILSRITEPTAGEITVRGRVAALLEVGTGFHPELTGRENIYMNGTILGMTKKEIDRKLDEIIDFSGIEKFLDTAVKFYSSGMKVRLGFSVAAHLEPELLVIDEVLAVGDYDFQKKCLGKMKEVAQGDRTVLFVSHNLGSVHELCDSCILLQQGRVELIGETGRVINHYLKNPLKLKNEQHLIDDQKTRRGNGEVRFVAIQINNDQYELDPEKAVTMEFTVKALQGVDKLAMGVMVRGPEGAEIITSSGLLMLSKAPVKAGSVLTYTLTIPGNTFRTGIFPLYLWLGRPKELVGDNYPYDVIDSVYVLNFMSYKKENELGYNPMKPMGYFNFPKTISEINLTLDAK